MDLLDKNFQSMKPWELPALRLEWRSWKIERGCFYAMNCNKAVFFAFTDVFWISSFYWLKGSRQGLVMDWDVLLWTNFPHFCDFKNNYNSCFIFPVQYKWRLIVVNFLQHLVINSNLNDEFNMQKTISIIRGFRKHYFCVRLVRHIPWLFISQNKHLGCKKCFTRRYTVVRLRNLFGIC